MGTEFERFLAEKGKRAGIYVGRPVGRRVRATFKEFLLACINAENWDANPILQDYMTPELVTLIAEMLK